MSIRRDNGEFMAECEDCGATHYGGVEDDFKAFVDDLKKEGWKIRKDEDSGEWEHRCEECVS